MMAAMAWFMIYLVVISFVGVISVVSAFQPFQATPKCNTKLHSTFDAYKIDIAENAQRDVNSLYEWAANYGVQLSPTFELSSSGDIYDEMDVCAITNQDIPAESPIVCVPSELILTGNKARLEFGNEVAAAERAVKLSDHSALYLFLKVLKEYELGNQSYWYTWLNSLPRYYSTGSAMTDFCFSCLPPYAAKQAQAEKSRLKRFQLALDEVLFLSDETKGNSALTEWAFNVVQTRYQENAGGDYCLIPMADYFNHAMGGTNIDVYLSFDDHGNCYANAIQDLATGQPLRILYGDPTNPSQLLAKYGFLDESSPTTYCKWIAEESSSEIFEMGYPSKMLFDTSGGISNEVWDVLLYTELGKISTEQQQAFFQAYMMGDEATKSNYHNQFFPQTLNNLQQHVDYILNELDELQTWQTTKLDSSSHPRLPLIMRHNDFVKNTFVMVQQTLRSMSS